MATRIKVYSSRLFYTKIAVVKQINIEVIRTNLKTVLQSDKEWKCDGLQNSLLIQCVFNLF